MKEKMDRITDISKVILPKGSILIKMAKNKESGIIFPEKVTDKREKQKHDFSYGEIIKKADNVTTYDVGDVALDFGPVDLFMWRGDYYCIILDLQVRVAVPKKYFDVNKKMELAI